MLFINASSFFTCQTNFNVFCSPLLYTSVTFNNLLIWLDVSVNDNMNDEKVALSTTFQRH